VDSYPKREGTTPCMIGRRFAGVICVLASLVVIVFLADANWSVLGAHPGRIWVPAILVLITLLLLMSALRLFRSSRRG
jgi:hypothetical protein